MNLIDHFRNKNLKNLVDCTSTYGSYEMGDLKVKPYLKELVKNFFDPLINNKKKILFLVSERKVLLQQIYKNIFEQLKVLAQIEVKFIDSLYPGIFTNYNSSNFLQPEQVLLLLTKNHNAKELRLLEQLKKTGKTINVITLGKPYYSKDLNIINIRNIKSLYWFMFTFLNQRRILTYKEFSKMFLFSTTQYNFKT